MPEIPRDGGADATLRRTAHELWIEAARAAHVDLTDFDPHATLDQRIVWALSLGLIIACIYTRYSSKAQHSTDDQARAVVQFAARNGFYVPPELICLDEAAKGRRIRRDGLARLKAILKARRATVLLVYKASRLFRQASEGFRLIQQEVVEEGLRAISVSQGIDTKDGRSWKIQLQAHGMADEMLLDAIADHCREGLIGLFLKGWSVGAHGVGYEAILIPGAPPTNRGLPRTGPAVHAATAEKIVRHAGWLLAGMNASDGARRWRVEKGPCDPRSTVGVMTNRSYRRLFANIRLTGRWEYGRKRNAWSTKHDGNRPEVQADSEVYTFLCEELRILSDATFLALQEKLGPLGVHANTRPGTRPHELHDLLTDLFHCPHCDRRFHAYGVDWRKMHCPGIDCPHHVVVDRPRAVAAVVAKLGELLAGDNDLIGQVVAATARLDARGDDDVAAEVADLERKVDGSTRKIDDLEELLGSGSDEDRAQTKAKIHAARADRAGTRANLERVRRAAAGRRAIGPDEVRNALTDFAAVLAAAGDGGIGDEAMFRAAALIRRLVGGRVVVIPGPRAIPKSAASSPRPCSSRSPRNLEFRSRPPGQHWPRSLSGCGGRRSTARARRPAVSTRTMASVSRRSAPSGASRRARRSGPITASTRWPGFPPRRRSPPGAGLAPSGPDRPPCQPSSPPTPLSRRGFLLRPAPERRTSMTPSRSSEIEADLAGDHRPPPSATAADPADHEADRSRLAEEIAWLVHRWLRLGRPPQDPNEFPVQIDGPSQP